MKQPIIFDVDTGIDDSLALLYLLASPEADILAITCTSGNVPARQVAINNLAWLELCRVEGIEVALGSEIPILAPLMTTEETHGPQGIGYAELPAPTTTISKRHATEVWIELAKSRPGEIIGLVTGPLTNLALALRIEPELPRLLKRLVVMGGSFNYPGNTRPTPDPPPPIRSSDMFRMRCASTWNFMRHMTRAFLPTCTIPSPRLWRFIPNGEPSGRRPSTSSWRGPSRGGRLSPTGAACGGVSRTPLSFSTRTHRHSSNTSSTGLEPSPGRSMTRSATGEEAGAEHQQFVRLSTICH